MYRMMRSLGKRGQVARVLHTGPTVWFNVSWKDERLKTELGSRGWYHFNHMMYRDGQVLFKTKSLQWIIKGVKMSRAQIGRHIKWQISDKEKIEQATHDS